MKKILLYISLALAAVFFVADLVDLVGFLRSPESYPIGSEMMDKGGLDYCSTFSFLCCRIIGAILCIILFFAAFRIIRKNGKYTLYLVVLSLLVLMLLLMKLPLLFPVCLYADICLS